MSALPLKPELALLGERDYLHGSTLFETMAHVAAGGSVDLEAIDFVFQRRTANQVAIVETEPGDEDLVVAIFTFGRRKLWAIGTDTTIVGRDHSNEKSLTTHFVVADRRVEVARSGLTQPFGAVVIAAFKTLLAKNEPAFRAVFARLKLDYIPAGDFSITYSRMIGGRFFEGRIEADGGAVGFIYFGIWS